MKLFIIILGVIALLGCYSAGGKFSLELPSARVETRTGPGADELREETRVVILGTGTPIPDAYRAGPGIAVVHKGETYLFDVGAGTVRNATVARYRYDIPSLYPTQICCAFITHMHSDHTLDLMELGYTMWWRRREGLKLWGPAGMGEMVAGMKATMLPDTRIRSSGTQPLPNAAGNQIDFVEIQEGVLLQKDDLTITAFPVNHGDIKPAFGFKVVTPDKSVVISGDTAFSERLIEEARGVDILLHEVISVAGLEKTTAFWQSYHKKAHTTSVDVGRVAMQAKPGLLVLYHGLYYGTPEEDVISEVRRVFDGPVVLANDLDVF